MHKIENYNYGNKNLLIRRIGTGNLGCLPPLLQLVPSRPVATGKVGQVLIIKDSSVFLYIQAKQYSS